MGIYKETNRIFNRKDMFQSLEEIRKASEKSGIVDIDNIKVSINLHERSWMFIEPYMGTDDFKLINDWDDSIEGIYASFPGEDTILRKLDDLYGESIDVLKKPEPIFSLNFEPLLENSSGWNKYKLTFKGSRKLCEKQDIKLEKALKNKNIYNSKLCCGCSDELRSYCKDVISILNKYSFSIPDNIRIEEV